MIIRVISRALVTLVVVSLSIFGISVPAQAATLADASVSTTGALAFMSNNTGPITVSATPVTAGANAFTVSFPVGWNITSAPTGACPAWLTVNVGTTSLECMDSFGSYKVAVRTTDGTTFAVGTPISLTFAAGSVYVGTSGTATVAMSTSLGYYGTAIDIASTTFPSMVTFAANGGTGTMATQSSRVPAALNANTYTRSGYTFAGWNQFSNGYGTQYLDGATYPFSASATIYAMWNATVTFDANGGSGTMANQVAYRPASLTSNAFTKSGSTFIGWNTQADGLGRAYYNTEQYDFVANVTLYAQWNTPTTHTVTYYANGGAGTMENQVASGWTTLRTNTFTREGYIFDSWNTEPDGSGDRSFIPMVDYDYDFSEDITLYAQWESSSGSSNPGTNEVVTFDPNGGSGIMNPQSGSGPTALSPNTFTRSGYRFVGWNSQPGGGGGNWADGASFHFGYSTTLFAMWRPIDTGALVPGLVPGAPTTVTKAISINVAIGGLVEGSTASISAGGLQQSAPYNVVVRSTPQTIGTGTAVAGVVDTSVTLPAGLEAGWHTLTFSSTAADGSAVTEVMYFKVSEAGTLLSTSNTVPAELAYTGSDSQGQFETALACLAIGIALVGFQVVRRKRAKMH